MVLELQGTEGMGDALQGIADGMGVVVHGIEAPLASGLVVDHPMADAVEHRVAHVEVRRGHVDPGPQGQRPVRELAGPHAREQVQILRNRTIAVGTLPTRFGQSPTVRAHLLRVELADVGQPLADQLDGESVELLEVVRGEVAPIPPIVAQPTHVLLDRRHELPVLLVGVGVVETQVAGALEVLGNAEVEHDGLGMTDMQIAVGLRREPGRDLIVLTRRQVLLDDLADEVGLYGGFFLGHRGVAVGTENLGKRARRHYASTHLPGNLQRRRPGPLPATVIGQTRSRA